MNYHELNMNYHELNMNYQKFLFSIAKNIIHEKFMFNS